MTRTLTQGIGGLVGILVTFALLAGCGGGGGDGGQVRMLEEQLASEEAARLAAEQEAAAEEAAKLAAERKAAAEEAARLLAEQKAAAEEAARLEAERAAAEEKARLEAEKAEAEREALDLQIAALRAQLQAVQEEEEEEPATDEEPDPAQSSSSLLNPVSDTGTDDTSTTDDDDTHPGLSALLGGTTPTDTTSTTTPPPSTTAQQPTTTQSLEANQRSERLLTVLRGVTPPTITAGASTSSRVAISVPTRNSLTFKNSDYTVSSITAPKLRGARLTRSRGGTQTTVVYADIELSRSLIKNYLTSATDETVEFSVTVPADANVLPDTNAYVITGHGFPTTKAATASPTGNTGMSFRGSLHGVSGKYECASADCLSFAATYTGDTRLATVTASGIATFKPDSRTAAVSLCDAPRSQCAATDTDYMAFGWWRSESTDGAYQFEPFAFGPALATSLTLPSGVTSAEFNGTAVGMYVEQSKAGAAIAKKQGEFTANARLDYASDTLTGTIDGFKTTPTGGSGAPSTTGWVLKLNASAAVVLQLHGPDGTGTWAHGYTTDGSAVVGTFQAGFTETDAPLTIAGAFGAQK